MLRAVVIGWARSRPSVRIAARIALAAGLVGVAVWISIVQPGATGLLAVVLLAPTLILSRRHTHADVVRAALTLACFVTALSYLGWRFEVISWAAWWIAVPLLVAEVFGILHSLGFAYTVWPRRPLPVDVTEDASQLPIFVFIPTVNEGRAILETTIRAVAEAKAQYLAGHPHARVRIVVCNDGRVAGYTEWQDIEALCEERGVECVTRTVRGGAKAGNIENARDVVGAHGDCLVVIFDADQVPMPWFLTRTIGMFGDANVGWVQTGQFYGNLENPVSKWADEQQAIFYQLLMPGKSTQNAAFICGTNVVIRASALDEIGGFSQNSVTEDFATSLDLHDRWKGVFVRGRLAVGLGPLDLPSYFTQQHRWALGTLGTLRTHGLKLAVGRSRMTAVQRVQYLQASTHYLSGLKDLTFVIAPLVFLAAGIPAVTGATLTDFLWQFLPYFAASQALFWAVAAGRTSWRGLLIGFGSFPVLIGSMISAITGRRVGFAVTSKHTSGRIGIAHLVPHLILVTAVVAVMGYALAIGNVGPSQSVSLLWAAYSAFSLGGILWLGFRDLSRHQLRSPAAKRSRRVEWTVVRRSVVWSVSVAASLLVVIGSLRLLPPSPAQAFPTMGSGERLLVGLSLPGTADLGTAPANIQPGIVGRTQVAADRFDREWADAVAASGAVVWITLLLDQGQRGLETSLASVTNGTHNADLRRWADDLRAFGAPVYLTVLPHVDRDWAKTSAVADGGIPQDVAPAWDRIHSVLAEEGARNVAMVWSPAAPSDDDRFAPSSDQVDAVLLSLIRYPGEAWPDARASIGSVLAQHPGKPVIVEVGAVGDAAEKSTWLTSVGSTAAAAPSVMALTYHEADPAGQADAQWSVRSDPVTLAAFKSLSSTSTAAARSAGVR